MFLENEFQVFKRLFMLIQLNAIENKTIAETMNVNLV